MTDQTVIRILWATIVAVVLMRIFGAAVLPIMDSHEARYSEIARKMVELNQYLVPMSTYEMPFWGKPPLSFWLTALSAKIFGFHELALRLPSILFGLLTSGLLFLLAKPDRLVGVLAILVFMSAQLGHTATGDVSTDPALTFFISLAMVGLWKGFIGDQRYWFWLASIGLGASLLVKGPLALVLVGASLFFWFIYSRSLLSSISQPRLWLGVTLALFIAAPWYWFAEQASPGFWQYFFVGEHFERFVNPEWSGDLYGSGHATPKGAIWYHALDAMLPWTLIVIPLLYFVARTFVINRLFVFLVCWCLGPLLLFSFGSNVRGTYIMPALPALALLTATIGAEWWRQDQKHWPLVLVTTLGLLVPGLKFLGAVNAETIYDSDRHQAPMVSYYQRQAEHQDGDLYYLGRRRRSAEYHSEGQVQYVKRWSEVDRRVTSYVAAHVKNQQAAPEFCSPLKEINDYVLYRCQ